MRFRASLACIVFLGFARICSPVEDNPRQINWADHFAQHEVAGTIVIVDERQGSPERLVHDEERAALRFLPRPHHRRQNHRRVVETFAKTPTENSGVTHGYGGEWGKMG